MRTKRTQYKTSHYLGFFLNKAYNNHHINKLEVFMRNLFEICICTTKVRYAFIKYVMKKKTSRK